MCALNKALRGQLGVRLKGRVTSECSQGDREEAGTAEVNSAMA